MSSSKGWVDLELKFNRMTLELIATKRDFKKDSPESLRKKGLIPSIFYGKKQKSTAIAVPFIDFTKVWKVAGESSVITLKMGNELFDCLIHDIDLDPIKNVPRHIDFYVFEKGQKLEVKVPIEFVGISPAVKDLGGILVKVLHELEIEASPKDLPHHIDVDISTLTNFDSQIAAVEIKLPSGVSLITDPEEVVASVYEPKEEKIEETTIAPDLSAIEVEKKGKKDEDVGGAESSTTDGGGDKA